MKLLFFYSSEINPQSGGVQRVTNDLAIYFKSLKHNVIYLATSYDEKNLIKNPDQFFLPNNNKLFSKENIEYYLNLIRENNIDLIINQDGMSYNVTKFCFIIKEYLPVKIITVFHNSLLGNVLNFSHTYSSVINKISVPYLKKIIQSKLITSLILLAYIFKHRYHYTYTCKKSDKVVLLSESFLPELRKLSPKLISSKIISIPNPCSLRPSNSSIIKINELLYVGRINSSQKKLDLLLEIWNKIYLKFPDWRLSIIGEGEEREKLESNSLKMGLVRIKFYGIQNPVPFYERAKILCMTSAYEGFPLVLAEAQSFGTIPIAFNSFASIHDIIVDNENGLLIEPFNIEKYVLHLTELMYNKEKLDSMSDKCKREALKFSIESIGQKWIEIFEDLLTNRNEQNR